MTAIRLLTRTALLCAVVLAAGCGGGGGALLDGGGIGGTGLHIGPNQGDGVVQLDGIQFDTTAAAITISNTAATTVEVKRGMVVVVEGSVTGSTGVANSVDVEEVVKGPLEQKLDAVTLVVLGQTVQIDPTTVFGPGIAPASSAGLLLGDLLKIYGFVRSSGAVFATRIERENSLSELRARGIVADLNSAAKTFRIGTQTIDYSLADTTDLPGGTPADGQLVVVRGLSMLSPTGQIVATEVRLDDFDELEDAEAAEVEGFVTSVQSATQFEVGGHAIQTDTATSFIGGTATEVVVGIRLKVKGARQNDVLVAARVVFSAPVKLESDVATRVGNLITLVGLPGVTVEVNASTEYEGAASAIGDIQPGEHVEIRGNKTGATSVVACQVEEVSASSDVVLQGPVDISPAPADPTLSILGVSVDTTGLADADFRGADEQQLGRAGFFTGLVAGALGEAEGSLSGTTVDWNEIKFEGEDE